MLSINTLFYLFCIGRFVGHSKSILFFLKTTMFNHYPLKCFSSAYLPNSLDFRSKTLVIDTPSF
ncbi:hypothetical protein HanIR_Chr14g0710551 [Helianthus annuus]|nr:hypothetical protein HanIR_Chr14g0710551 [Helianthus annuus]